MNRIKAALIFLILLAAACHKKAVPVITERKTELPKKFESIYPPEQTVSPDTIAGKRIFMARCDRCHGLPGTKQFSVEKWDDILPTMFPRAGLNNEEALHVRAYILANTTK